ncbi:hypothetical protein V8D89_002627 [Ganoderma adspersum]
MEYKSRECGASTSTLSPGTHNILRTDFRSSCRVDLLQHVLFHDGDTLWDRFLVPFLFNPSDSPSGDQELINKVVTALKTTCLQELNDIQEIQAAPSRNENRMMKPLDTLFSTIEKETAKHCKTREYFRAFIRKDSTLVPLTNPPFGSLSIVKPDFVLADLPPPNRGVVINVSARKGHVDWRQCPAFIEIKAKSECLPIPPHGPHTGNSAWKDTLAQGADYARLLMAGRPFLISAYAFFICGNKFCIALCDRAGMVLSPAKSLSPAADAVADLEYFVRVVLRFTWDMSLAELGEDPTAALTPDHTSYQRDYPRYDVGMGRGLSPGSETAKWTTVGEPLWVSHSLLGRGTSVWRALDQQTPLILKTSWRTLGRRSETEIHGTLRSFLQNSNIDEPRGLALASAGGDVYDFSGKIMSVSNRRGPPEEIYKPVLDRVLHRVCLTRFGKPIWQYSSLEEFARAMRDALQAHDILSSYGILHRDVSAGNILIDVDASYKATTATGEPGEGIVSEDRDPQNASGFLSDWEFAWLPQHVLDVANTNSAEPQPDEPDMDIKITPGDILTGTPIFFATELLIGLKEKRPVVRTRVHDLESFEWVILYAAYEHSIESAGNGTKEAKERVPMLMKEFQTIFTAIDPSALASNRELLLAWPGHPTADLFVKIKELTSFVKDVVRSEELLVLLMDVWQDLLHRRLQLFSTFQAPARSGSHFQYIQQAAFPSFSCMKHQELIRCLEKLIPRS